MRNVRLNRKQYTTVTGSLGSQLVISTSPIKVTSMFFTKTGGAAVGLITGTTGDGTTTLFVAQVPGTGGTANNTIAWELGAECEFPDGLAFAADVANTRVAVTFTRDL